MNKITTKTEEETIEVAKNYAAKLKGGDVLALVGNLGAGKTVFSRAVASYLKIKENISSPTFVYMKIYEITGSPSIKKLCHIDAYRLDDERLLIKIGASEYIGHPDVLTIIEWADKVEAILPANHQKIIFEIDKQQRTINFSN